METQFASVVDLDRGGLWCCGLFGAGGRRPGAGLDTG